MRVIFHTGFMKTGSTYLQRNVFPAIPHCRVHSYGAGDPFVPLVRDLRAAGRKPDPAQVEALRTMAGVEPIQLFSWEGLVGNFRNDHREFEWMSRFLRDAFADAHILLVLRRQPDLVESLYKQALQTGHSVTPDAFVNRRGDGFGAFRPDGPVNLDVARFDFDAFVETYERLFAPERVHVLPYELLRADRSAFADRLGDAIGTKVDLPQENSGANVGYNRTTARLARRVNRVYRTPHAPGGLIPYRPFDGWLERNPHRTPLRRLASAANAACDPRALLQSRFAQRLPGGSEILPTEVRQAITTLHRESNRRLDARLNLGLRALGYY